MLKKKYTRELALVLSWTARGMTRLSDAQGWWAGLLIGVCAALCDLELA